MGEVVELIPSTADPDVDDVVEPPAPAEWLIDDWGRDDRFARITAAVLKTAWSVTLGGAERLPKTRSAMLVTNARRFTLAPWFVSLLASSTERPIRFVGRPDTAPLGALARRLGGLLDRPDEIAGALADGQLVIAAASPTLDPRAVGTIDPEVIGIAVRAGAPIHPVATSLSPLSRSARIEIGPATRPPAGRRGPLAEIELAERLQRRIAELIEASGTPRTGTPLDWIPLGPSGGA